MPEPRRAVCFVGEGFRACLTTRQSHCDQFINGRLAVHCAHVGNALTLPLCSERTNLHLTCVSPRLVRDVCVSFALKPIHTKSQKDTK